MLDRGRMMKIMLKLESLFITLLVYNVIGHLIPDQHYMIISSDSPKKMPGRTRPTDHAKVARQLVHKANWAGTGTISTTDNIKGYPMVNIISIADSGKDEPSTGHIYFYLTILDYTAQDIKADNKMTMMVSDDQDLACSNENIDPMEPTCSRAIISGSVSEIDVNAPEYNTTAKAFISRHPAAENWIDVHRFTLCKLDICNILVLDWYGGPHTVSAEDYYNVKLD